jgi:hypothetical protein
MKVETDEDYKKRMELESIMRELSILVKSQIPQGVGFALLVFDFGEGGFLAYGSNAERQGMIHTVEEWLARVKDKQ